LRSRYLLEEVMGQGGTSTVYRAKDLLRSHTVAIKLLLSERCADPPRVRRLQYEFLQMQSLTHPGIVRVLDFACEGDICFVSMEFVAGPTVKRWSATPRSYPDSLKLVASCCLALEHAHSVGVIHGDLKSTNVMVTTDGTGKLIDFGSASSRGVVRAAGSLPLAATPSYASPQILAGRSPEQRDDIYSLACLTYSILSGGRHPFGGRPSFEHGRAKCAPSYAPTIPLELFEVIERSLSVQPERRAASAGEFLRDLLEADRRHRAVDAPTTPMTQHPADDRARQPAGITSVPARRFSLAHVLAGVLAIVGAVSLQVDRQHELVNAAKLPSKAAAEPPVQALPKVPAIVADQTLSLPEVRFPPHSREAISFDAPTTVHVSARQTLVAINVRRLTARGRASFVWRLENVVGFLDVDRRGLAPQTATFNEGQVVRTLFIPLINRSNRGVIAGPGSFSVVLRRVAGGPALGPITRVRVVTDPSPNAGPAIIQARAAE
jgi:serine/threonine protein kinase